MKKSITFRPITSEDEHFLYRLYASTRAEELAQTTWTEAEKEIFLKQQFAAQHHYYSQQFIGASFNIVLLDNQPAGRLYIDRRKDEIRIIDIALLPEHRNKRIGTTLLTNLLEEAKKLQKPIRIHVEKFNPALQLYQRLGFREMSDSGVYYLMAWSPDKTVSDKKDS